MNKLIFSNVNLLLLRLVSMQSDNERLRSRLITSPDPVDRVIARSPSPVRTPVSYSTLGTSVVDGAPTSLYADCSLTVSSCFIIV